GRAQAPSPLDRGASRPLISARRLDQHVASLLRRQSAQGQLQAPRLLLQPDPAQLAEQFRPFPRRVLIDGNHAAVTRLFHEVPPSVPAGPAVFVFTCFPPAARWTATK